MGLDHQRFAIKAIIRKSCKRVITSGRSRQDAERMIHAEMRKSRIDVPIDFDQLLDRAYEKMLKKSSQAVHKD